MSSPAAAGAATSGAKRSRGRPPKPEDEKKQARLWRCSVEPFTDADRDRLRSCGSDVAMTKRFAMRQCGSRLEALFSFTGSAKRAGQLNATVLEASWQPLPMTEYTQLVLEFEESRDDTHPGVASSSSKCVVAESPPQHANSSPESGATAPPPPPCKAVRFWRSLADPLSLLRAEMNSAAHQLEPMQLPPVDPHGQSRKGAPVDAENTWAKAMRLHYNGLCIEQKDNQSHPDFLSRFAIENNPRRLHLLDGTPWAIAASHNGVFERCLSGSDGWSGNEYRLAVFLHSIIIDERAPCSAARVPHKPWTDCARPPCSPWLCPMPAPSAHSPRACRARCHWRRIRRHAGTLHERLRH